VIGKRSRTHAFQIAAHRRKRQIEREDFFLRIALLELESADHLEELVDQAARTRAFEQARGLHGKRGSTGNDVCASGQILLRSAADGEQIDAEVGVETVVFVAFEQRKISRGYIADAGFETP